MLGTPEAPEVAHLRQNGVRQDRPHARQTLQTLALRCRAQLAIDAPRHPGDLTTNVIQQLQVTLQRRTPALPEAPALLVVVRERLEAFYVKDLGRRPTEGELSELLAFAG